MVNLEEIMENGKKTYVTPHLEIECLEVDDIITTSTNTNEGDVYGQDNEDKTINDPF